MSLKQTKAKNLNQVVAQRQNKRVTQCPNTQKKRVRKIIIREQLRIKKTKMQESAREDVLKNLETYVELQVQRGPNNILNIQEFNLFIQIFEYSQRDAKDYEQFK